MPADKLCPDASVNTKDPAVWFQEPVPPNIVVALGDPTSLIAKALMLLLLPVALPVRPCMVIFENDGVLSGELRARVTVIVLSWLGLLVDWPMLTLKSDRAWTKSGAASPAI